MFGAQPVAIKRDEELIFKKIRVIAAAAGDDFYYRFPVKKKIKDPETGKDEWVQDYIEGPTIKCANAVARLFGNCDTDVRVFDSGGHWLFYARFMDLETGYCLTRPFQQRKGQGSLRGDSGRAEDIAFQIGTSKAIRTVTCNALELFHDIRLQQEAKASIIEKVGKRLDYYKEKIAERLKDMEIALHRVEAVRGRPLKDWIATDVAKTIAEVQAINDGMATTDETFPPKGEQKAEGETDKLDGFATDHDPETGEVKEAVATDQQQTQGSQSDAIPSPPSGASGSKEDAEGETGGSAPSSNTSASSTNSTDPKTDVEYKIYALKWIAETPNREDRMAPMRGKRPCATRPTSCLKRRDELEALVKKKSR